VLRHQGEIPVPDEVVMFQMMGEAATEAYYDVYPGTPVDSAETKQHDPNITRRRSGPSVFLLIGVAVILVFMITNC
jgi:hypothetical protein